MHKVDYEFEMDIIPRNNGYFTCCLYGRYKQLSATGYGDTPLDAMSCAIRQLT